ncbi:hypothetical protein ASG31_09385 [Chryseobacterium sp. Leaf404]|uniref:hypothetical protein n=1 Tax=unclassified Chryseobacterium TaxID=2593645 RepID=UPI0006F65FB4|nr:MULTISPECIES: hypothetical protein [unclassified Chryseobacterium]KQT17603.1 hypothetical protein ASG31_09385 [Chryseobacterium sp. Leaf404]
MKNTWIALFVILSNFLYSQPGFEKGEAITKNGEKIEGLFSRSAYHSVPEFLIFKKSDEAKPENIFTGNLKEFWVGKKIFFLGEAMIDRSLTANRIRAISKNPHFESNLETIWLEILLTGKLNLYNYYKHEVVRYFYRKESEQEIKQLNYKEYSTNENYLKRNEEYKNQLTELFSDCPKITQDKIEKLYYDAEPLKRIFKLYNNDGMASKRN